MNKQIMTLGVIITMTASGIALCAETSLDLAPVMEGVTKLAFYGDSLTDGNNYPEYVINTLNKAYPGRNFSFVNAGVCGNRASDLVDRLDREILSQKPDLTFILIGTNDKNGVPLI